MLSASNLCAGKFVQKRSCPRPRPKETVYLKGDDRSRVEPQRASVFGKVGQQVMRVEEAHHGHTRSNVHRVDVVAVDEGAEAVDHIRR